MRMKLLVASVAAAMLLTGAAQARPIFFFHADLDGLQETPPVVTTGTGVAELEFDDSTNTLTITSSSFQDLVSPSTAAHVHGLAPAGIIFGLTINPGVGVTSGTLSGSGVLTPAQVIGLFDGLLYINVHSQQFPGGEIRGQIFLIPAPGAAMLLGLAGLVGTRRRRT